MKETSLNRLAFTATVHCLTGCAIGNASLDSGLFWGSLALSLLLAASAAFPVNRWLISQGRGHAVVHHYHGHGTH
jgi:hypothetical protein